MADPYKVQWTAKSDKPTIGLSTSESIMGNFIKVGLFQKPDSDGSADLVGDTFWASYKHGAQTIEKPPEERSINKAVMDWALEQPGWSNAEIAGNLPASMASSSTLWQMLLSNEVIKAALERQKQAEELKQQAEKDRQGALEKLRDGDEEGFQQLIDQANKAEQDANKMINGALKKLDKNKQDPLASSAISNATKKASEEGKKVAGFVRGWGLDPSTINFQQADEILKFAKSDNMKMIAELIGRSQGIAADQISKTKDSIIRSVSEYKKTKRIMDMTYYQRMKLSKNAPDNLRMKTIQQWATSGLFGVVPKQSERMKGSSLHIVDESGSMGYHGTALEKAIAIGTAIAIREGFEHDRYYEMYGFASSHRVGRGRYSYYGTVDLDSFPGIKSTDDFQRHVAWTAECLNGETDFVAAFTLAIDRLNAIKQMGIDGCDLVFYSDGIADLDSDTIDRFMEVKSVLSVRMIFIQFGEFRNEQVKGMSDVYIQLPDAYSIDLEDLTRKVAEIATEHFFTGLGGD